ncbi:hypothetical protein [Novosphingobium gossypii]|uniref:hypothetical protein n=1 Tax=Novosphingobium gossypii TaxID=1604774 RepID=UPI003D24DD16
MTRAKARLLTLILPFGMAACSTGGSYPSLAIRDVERPSGTATAASGTQADAAPVLPPASADLVTRLAGLVKVAQDADTRFQSNRTAAERAVAAAGSAGSDSWSSATVALARLESSRSAAMTALAELDTLYADARDKAPLGESPTSQAIGDARSKVAALVNAQDQAINALSSRLRT